VSRRSSRPCSPVTSSSRSSPRTPRWSVPPWSRTARPSIASSARSASSWRSPARGHRRLHRRDRAGAGAGQRARRRHEPPPSPRRDGGAALRPARRPLPRRRPGHAARLPGGGARRAGGRRGPPHLGPAPLDAARPDLRGARPRLPAAARPAAAPSLGRDPGPGARGHAGLPAAADRRGRRRRRPRRRGRGRDRLRRRRGAQPAVPRHDRARRGRRRRRRRRR
jgi:hypothetical protein